METLHVRSLDASWTAVYCHAGRAVTTFYDCRCDHWAWGKLVPGDCVTFSHMSNVTILNTNDIAYIAHGVFLVLTVISERTHHGLTTLNVWLYFQDGEIYRKRVNDTTGYKVVE